MASKIRAFDFYLLRVPRLSSEVARKLNGFSNNEEAWNYIVDLLNDPEILDALYLASGDLFEELTHRIGREYSPSVNKILLTLYKYLSRMASRPTPYGKFSGVSLGEFSEFATSIKVSGEFLSTYRMDMGFTGHLSQLALERQDAQSRLIYFTNSTLYETTDYFKYIDFQERDDRRYYHWAKVPKNPLLKYILELSEAGKHFEELADSLQKLEIPKDKALQFLYKLIEIKLLISELEPIITGFDTKDIVSRLKNVDDSTFPISKLLSLENCLQAINCNQVQSFTARKNFKNLTDYPVRNLFQADMLIDCSLNQISKQVAENLASELEELSVLNRSQTPPDLKSFRRKFTARYGDKEVPLLEAINQENGIGYGISQVGDSENNPLIQGLGTRKVDENKNDVQRSIQSIMDRYWPTGTKVTPPLELDHRDLRSLSSANENPIENLPVGFYILGNLLVSKDREMDNGEYRFNLLAAGGVSSIPLMTRFSHLDTKLEAKLKDCVDWEEKHGSETVFAEVVYLPENRVGNILARPKLFKYEIPIIGQSRAEGDFKISLDDLWVSVRHGKIILRSKRLNKQVIPRLSSAHNFHYGMVVYRFLCDLQFQSDSLDLSWGWGKFSNRPFLPRVTYKHIIVSRAKWNISRASIHSVSGTDNKSKIVCLKERFELPDLVSLTEGDNELLVDLRSPLGAEIVLKQLGKRDLVLHEYLFDQYESPVRDAGGAQFNNEIIIPLRVDRPIKGVKFKPDSVQNVKRSFQPGSEWLYVKIYCGVSESDRILSEHVMQLINELKRANLIEKWFFIRYYDPDSHIRLRVLIRKEEGKVPFQQVVDCINQYLGPLINNYAIHRIVYDTYDRELERYGQGNIETCESVFYIDSESILPLLPLFKQAEGEQLRWLMGMLGVENLFTAFGLGIKERISLVTTLRDAFLIEFSGYEKLKYKLDRKYRENRDRIRDFFESSHSNSSIIPINLLQRFNVLKNTIEPIKSLNGNNDELFDLISSLSHMYINRVFTVKQRENEMIIYHFLAKYYQEIAKRNKSGYSTTMSHRNSFTN